MRLRDADAEPVRCESCGQVLGTGPDGGGAAPAAGTVPAGPDERAEHVCPEEGTAATGTDGPGPQIDPGGTAGEQG